jgi:methyl-accepting chemotaxis protein
MAASIKTLMDRLEESVAGVPGMVDALTKAIEADTSGETGELRQQMTELYQQLLALTTKVEDKLQQAKALVERAERQHGKTEKQLENAQALADGVENMVSELQSATESLNPEAWEWE